MWQPDDRDLLHRRVAQQNAFHLDRRDVLAAADDHVLDAVANLRVAVPMDYGGITGVEPAVAHDLLRGFWIVVVAAHDNVSADDYLAERLTVGSNVLQLGVDHSQLARRDELHTLPRLDHRSLGQLHLLMLRSRLAHRDEGRR